MLRLTLSLSLLALSLAGIAKRSTHDECYRCSTWDALGRGFIEADDNPPMCGHYKECYKAKDSGVITSVDRWCAPGTWTDPDDIRRGAPCTSTECNTTMCECDMPTASMPVTGGPCVYIQMSPAWLFGMWNGAVIEEVGTCGDNGYFNDTDGICTCTSMIVDCTCKVSIPLTTDTESHGCNGGWVGQLGMPAMATVSSSCGQFGGFDSTLNNGAHLGTYVIDGTFAGDWVHQLKLTAALNLDSSWDNTPVDTKWGVVTYGDCAAGSSFAFSVQKNSTDTYLVADLELMTESGLEQYTMAVGGILSGVMYHASFIYQESLNPSWVLFLMSDTESGDCLANIANCPSPVASSNPKGTITPRGCGFVIGHTSSDSNEEFFVGEICNVSVDIGSAPENPNPCS